DHGSCQAAPDEDPTVFDCKVGLHEGPALAVLRDERLDYFGQTVNIAARVQGLASAGEIWLTEPVASAPETRNLMAVERLGSESRHAHLKGVGAETLVYRIYSPQVSAL
ncbi:MAG TPA: adenylate/guanylate cyclase domain-containing protein, partial [Turneriella sp.]|nr:adenylate/guanylate cyclase domain-containing protein [Turneriella sp.]HNL55447.1 adenylate/guanylate cyclase domain-containing protein [Turneriella sp.]